MLPPGRHSGVLLPLFSLRTPRDFGVGDFGALPAFFDWMTQAGQRVLMLLPLLPTSPGDDSPYACRSAFGLNPLFLDLHQIPEFLEVGGVSSLSEYERRELSEAQAAATVQYRRVWPLKLGALRRAFERFEEREIGSKRAQAFERFRTSQEWLDEFSLYTALSEQQQRRAFWEWPEPLRNRHPQALEQARAELSREVRYAAWLQWQGHLQWQSVREQAGGRGIFLCGDEPFTVGRDSADAWAHPELLRQDARLGVPPDEFTPEGQDWGLPWFDFAAMEKEDFSWFRRRARHAAECFDFRRVDHAVGYFRQWIRDEQTPRGRFVPSHEPDQQALGEKLFRLLSQDSGVVAEDLGLIPPFVYRTLEQLRIPGYRVMRWERYDGHYRDPQGYPALSLVTTGTHDTETLADWWEQEASWLKKRAAEAWPQLRALGEVPAAFTLQVHQALIAEALHTPSTLCILPWQDIFGTRTRINLPGTVSSDNWSFRLNRNVGELLSDPQIRERTEWLAERVRSSGRGGALQ